MALFDAGIPLAVVITEGVAVKDTAEFYNYAKDKGTTRIVGPNCPGLITPGVANAGIMLLRDPVRLRQFSSFVNAPDAADPTLAYVTERGQHRPATAAERAAGGTASGPVLIAPTTLEVRS